MKTIEENTNSEKNLKVVKAKTREIEITKEEPFKNDKLNREKYAKVLTSTAKAYQDGAVLALNGAWGTGKTTFVKMWEQHLKNNGFPVVYYNAWEDDICEEPLVSMVRGFKNEIGNKNTEECKHFMQAGAKVLLGIATGAVKGFLGPLGNGIVEAASGGMEQLQKVFEDEIDKEDSNLKVLKDFRDSLGLYVQTKCKDGKPLIYFVDELDRCSPTYSVKVLERIKHLFEVSNVVFVLSIDKQQLAYSINGYYGSDNINSMEYLRRFIDIDYYLPEPEPKDYCEYLFDYYGYSDFIFRESRIKIDAGTVVTKEKDDFVSMATLIVQHKHLNLRQAERIFALARIALCEMSSNSKLFADVYFLLAYLKVCEQEIFEKIDALNYRLQELIDEFETLATDDLIKEDQKGYASYLVAVCHLLFCYAESISEVYRHPDPRHETIYDMNSSEHSSNITFNKFDKEQAYSIMYHYNQRRPDMTCRIEHFTRKLSLLEYFQIE